MQTVGGQVEHEHEHGRQPRRVQCGGDVGEHAEEGRACRLVFVYGPRVPSGVVAVRRGQRTERERL